MTSDAAAAKTSDLAAAPSVLPTGVRTRILIYLGGLIVLLGFGSPGGGRIGLPISFLLKNNLHLQAHEVAIFGLITGAPSCVSLLFGFARDTWNPFGIRDRGFMVLFGGLCAAVYVLFALPYSSARPSMRRICSSSDTPSSACARSRRGRARGNSRLARRGRGLRN